MKNSLRAKFLAFVAVSLLAVSVTASSLEAATWTKTSFASSSCAGWGPAAARVAMGRYSSAHGECWVNLTTTNSDSNLSQGDTWINLSPMAPGIRHFAPPSGDPVDFMVIWTGTGCTGSKQSIQVAFEAAINYYSYKRNSSVNGC